MTAAEFTKHITESINEEKKDIEKYMQMAQAAPSDPMRDMLYEIVKDEVMHHAKLECMKITLEGSL